MENGQVSFDNFYEIDSMTLWPVEDGLEANDYWNVQVVKSVLQEWQWNELF